MKRDEQIISEAKKYYYDDINCHNAFLHGVEWADEHPKVDEEWQNLTRYEEVCKILKELKEKGGQK